MSFNVVMAQLSSTSDKNKNLEKAEKAIQESVDLYNAELVVFPEAFMCYFEVGTPSEEKIKEAESIDGNFVNSMRVLSKKYGVWTVFCMSEKIDDQNDNRSYNTTIMLDSSGEIKGVYRKTHLYDAFGAKESKTIKPGDGLFEPIDTPFGKIGIFVCYELRFPEIARHQAMKGADILIVPTGWVRGPLKERHWENLVTTRALENTVYLIGCGHVNDFYLGRSMVVDPMGLTIAQGTEKEGLIPCRIDKKRIEEVRKVLPTHTHRRPE